MCERNYELAPLGSEVWDKFFGSGGGRLVYQVGREGVDRREPATLIISREYTCLLKRSENRGQNAVQLSRRLPAGNEAVATSVPGKVMSATRTGKARLKETYHSLSARPMTPILTPLEDTRIFVFSHLARETSLPSAGSSTFASSHGNVHCDFKFSNCDMPKSRSWF